MPVKARIKEKRDVAKRTLMVVFDLLGEEVDFRPGQYFWVTLLDPPYYDEKGPRRHITGVTSPNEHGVLGLCTRIRDTAFKRSLVELPVGADVEVEEPKGNFLLPEDTSQDYVFVAGGIGITVFRCMLRYIAEEDLPHRVTLVYSSRVRADFLRDHLDGALDSFTYYIAGPPGMVDGVAEMLQAEGIPEERVVPARFSGY